MFLPLSLLIAATALAGIEESQYAGSIEADPIRYSGPAPAPAPGSPGTPGSASGAVDVVARLIEDVKAGRQPLAWDEQHGYLPALLKALEIPIESQVLVYSKTSFQNSRISPATPRAIYFNDDVYVGWVQHGDVLEIAATDPRRGPIFYTLPQRPQKPQTLSLARNAQCLQCHVGNRTMGVPGPMVRSVYTHPAGFPLLTADTFDTDHRSELRERWGGWYVTGTHGQQRHMGNITVRTERQAADADLDQGANVTDLSRLIDTSAYLSPHSDIVALMVLEHQCHMHNLLTRASYETQHALMLQQSMGQTPDGELSEATQRRIQQAGDAVLRYMLFADEAYLTDPIEGGSGFAERFAAQGPHDGQGRSLRELDLGKYLFRYPCSYMIYSEAFDSLPAAMKEHVYRRLHDVLTGGDDSIRISTAKRQAILEILRETKDDLPDYWRK